MDDEQYIDIPCVLGMRQVSPSKPVGGVSAAQFRAYRERMREALDGGGSPWIAPDVIDELLRDDAFLTLIRAVFAAETEGDFDRLSATQKQTVAKSLGALFMVVKQGLVDVTFEADPSPPEVFRFSTGPLPISLTNDDKAQIRHAAANPRGRWAMPPLLVGAWEELEPTDAATLLEMVSSAQPLGEGRTPFAVAVSADRVRTRGLACYPKGLLVEAQGYGAGGKPGVAAFILHPDLIALADGSSAPIFLTNEHHAPVLDTPAARLDYLMLFMNWVRASHGRFLPLQTGDEVAHRIGSAFAERARACAVPVAERDLDSLGRWLFDLRLVYGADVYDARMSLDPTGLVEMIDEIDVQLRLPLLAELMDGPLLVLAEVRVASDRSPVEEPS